MRIVANEHFDAVRIVRLAHLFLQFPGGAGGVVQAHMAVVVAWIRGVGDPEVIRPDLDIGDATVVFYRGFVSNPDSPERKDPGGGASITLLFDFCIARVWVQPQPPYEPVFAESALVGAQYAHPLAVAVFFNE